MRILEKYVAAQVEKGVIDEWVLFENAYDRADRATTLELRAKYPWVTVFENEGHHDAFFIHSYYKQFTDREAVYVRLDDDLVYIAPDAIEKLVEYRLANKGPFLVFPTIIGNTRMSYHMQQKGIIPAEWGTVSNNILDSLAWTDPVFIERVHHLALAHLTKTDRGLKDFALDSFMLDSIDNGHISVNCFAMLGNDMVDIGDKIVSDEERYLSMYRPGELGRLNAICGDAIVVHYAYHTQREALDKTDILAQYEALAT